MPRYMLIDGEWHTDVPGRTNDEGEYESAEPVFCDRIRDTADATFPAESGRYHLYISYACPWAHGALLVRQLAGLVNDISVDVVDPFREEDGWQFTPAKPGCTPDTINGFDFLRETYVAADADYTGRVTVPVLWDRERETIVNNESIDIMRMLATAFDGYGTDIDLYPCDHRSQIDQIVADIYETINTGVYKAGFAETQEAYETAVTELFAALDHWDSVLSTQRYLLGESMTLADLRLFATLIRFDQVYHIHFKCNKCAIREYDHLWPYLRDLYQTPGIADTVRMSHIKEHYYMTHPNLNPSGIIPLGPDLDLSDPHDRDELPGQPPTASTDVA